MFDVFLAHNSQDKPSVRVICRKLRDIGLNPWLDEEQIPPGSSFQQEIQQAITQVKSVAVFLGTSGLGRWQSLELRSFISQCVERGIVVIPVLLPGVKSIPEDLVFLREFHSIFVEDVENEQAVQGLYWGITRQKFNPSTSVSPISAPSSESAQTLIVSALGRGQYRRISDAIANAKDGARILVREGFYHEGLVIDKPLEIIGDGVASEIILEYSDSYCIQMKTDYARVQGLTICGRAGLKGNKYYAVDIPQGCLILEDCDVTSDSLSCVGVHGLTAKPMIRRCKIHDGKVSGVYVWENGQGIVEDCDIFANAYSGVAIKEEANPTIRRCKIHDGKSAGVMVWENGQGIVEDCDIFANAYSGVQISEEVNPTIRRCKIHDGKEGGVMVLENGQGIVEDCDIFANAYSGVNIKQEANPTIRQSRINRNGYEAIYSHDNGKGTVENCDLTGNERGAFDIDSSSQVKQSNNKT